MITKLTDLNREEKIVFLREVLRGNVPRESLHDNTYIGIEASDAFLCMMMAGTARERNCNHTRCFICIGAAQIELEKISEQLIR